MGLLLGTLAVFDRATRTLVGEPCRAGSVGLAHDVGVQSSHDTSRKKSIV